MSSQAVRNIIQTGIKRIIPMAEKRLREEGNKKIIELEEKLSNPEEVMKILGAEINPNTCSIQGRNSFKDKADSLKQTLNELKEIAQLGVNAIQGIEDEIAPLTDKIEKPEDAPPGPIEKIQKISDDLSPIMEALQFIVIAAPAILAAYSGPTANGLAIANTSAQVDLAKAKISEFTNLISSIPNLMNRYKQMIDGLVAKITVIKDKIQKIIDKIDELILFIIYLEFKFEDDCNKSASAGADDPPLIEPAITSPPPLTLEDIINQAEKLYGDLLNDLIGKGDLYGIRRVYVLGENFQRIKNTRIENLGRTFGPMP